ncbi:1662_t:CDS:2 [Funneliformis geosporum]|uniref:18236_t:CDS:1 n=1 Tax=Funneliformis geosporum TaxID=1117311 RepID=A0A9W4SH16_9GLOM|nr:18236_t:CDS:2 [Funneliformis geosporum]CAI2172534.1 1662_t:CDS:2 [Funneliformis geosporum]
MIDGDGTCILPPWKPITQEQYPIDVIPGRTIAKIIHGPLNGKQKIDVECDSVYQYHFPSMRSGKKFLDWDQKKDGLLKFEEEYIMIKCGTISNFLTREPFKSDDNKSRSFNLPFKSVLKGQKPLVNDVVLILLDAVSREHFNEEFPRTLEFLKDMSNRTKGTHKSHSFNRYNVLGQNSPPNKAFIYSGQSKDYLWSNGNKAKATWLWDVYESQGFVTMHTDGECGGWWAFPYRGYADGAITSYYKATREDKLPANHQFPHVSICENYAFYHDGEFGRTCKLTNGQDENGERHKRLATITLMDTHNADLNLIGLDKSMVNLLTKLLIGKGNQQPLLDENSIVIVLSDHGIHYGFEYASYEGYLHHKQPLLHMVLPKDISTVYNENMEANQNVLTTHADLHMTLLTWLSEKVQMIQIKTCSKLGIPTEYCPCVKYTELENTKEKDEKIINRLIEFAVSFMNDKIKEFGVGKICNKFDYDISKAINGSVESTFTYGDLEYYSGYYLPSTSLNSRIYAVTVNVKSYTAKLKFSSTFINIVNKNTNDLSVTQITAYKEEWEGICRNKIYKNIKNEKQGQESEAYI